VGVSVGHRDTDSLIQGSTIRRSQARIFRLSRALATPRTATAASNRIENSGNDTGGDRRAGRARTSC
jgi:hypothetical protein